ncbi:MAG: sulfatase-like hydrolase/transferase [Deltaproteobacteria bacterium]|nr:sulfatase-like hydrolase/transferase [Deltaproteobacteria bacterium]
MVSTFKRSPIRLLMALLALATALAAKGCGGASVDFEPPQNVSLSVNGGKAYTTSKTVSLDISATDNAGVNAYYISESPDAPAPDSAGWVSVTPSQGYNGTVSHELSGDYGDRKLYVWFRDTSSNVSETASAVINLAFVAPDVASPNIIMVVVDTLRADHLPLYGYSRDTAPNISALAGSSVVFENAYSAAPWTLPSFASMLLGKQAYNHDYNVAAGIAPASEKMLPGLLQDNGYHTVSVQTNAFVLNLHNGFDEKADFTDDNIGYNDGAAVNHAMDWLNNLSIARKKFFLFIGLISPHWPYKTNNGFLSNFVMDPLYVSSSQFLVTLGTDGAITYDALPGDVQSLLGQPSNGRYYMDSRLYVAAYDSEIRYADEQIGRLIATLKNRNMYEDSIIIVTSDHGENMVEHNTYFTHGNNLYNSLLRVPLLIKFPGQTSAKHITADVRTIDILPTVLDYAGIDAPDIDGKSLLPVINDVNVNFEERPVIAYRVDLSAQAAKSVSVVKDGYKLIKNPVGPELYDLTADKDEFSDLSASESERVNDLNEYLLQFYAY